MYQIIELPEEPAEDEHDVVMVTIHTVLDQRHSRRFRASAKLQVCFNFMVFHFQLTRVLYAQSEPM